MISKEKLDNSDYQALCDKYSVLEIISQSKGKRKCSCGKVYEVKFADLKRGWGMSCGKSCSARKREKSRPGYSLSKALENNERRANWNDKPISEMSIAELDDGMDYLSECGDKGEW